MPTVSFLFLFYFSFPFFRWGRGEDSKFGQFRDPRFLQPELLKVVWGSAGAIAAQARWMRLLGWLLETLEPSRLKQHSSGTLSRKETGSVD
jgi:hypothetical protein